MSLEPLADLGVNGHGSDAREGEAKWKPRYEAVARGTIG